MTTVASMGYGPSSSPTVPIANVQPGFEISHFVPRASVPVKFVQYGNLVVGNSGGGPQYGPRNSLPVRFFFSFSELRLARVMDAFFFPWI